MREHFEEWTKRSQKPAFSIAELKRAVRSENFPHNHFQWKGNRRDAELVSAEDIYLGLKLLARLHPERAVNDMIISAFFPLQAAIVEKVKERDPEQLRATGDRAAYTEANHLEQAFEAAIDRALDRRMSNVRGR